MIKLKNATSNIIRETTVDFVFTNDQGEKETQNIRVRYHDWTTKQLKEQEAERIARKEKNESLWKSEALFTRLHSLPDIVDDDGHPIEITLAVIESLEMANLLAIESAIDADLNPKKLTGDSSPAA